MLSTFTTHVKFLLNSVHQTRSPAVAEGPCDVGVPVEMLNDWAICLMKTDACQPVTLKSFHIAATEVYCRRTINWQLSSFISLQGERALRSTSFTL